MTDALLAVFNLDPLNVEPSPTDVDKVSLIHGEACPEKAVVATQSCRWCCNVTVSVLIIRASQPSPPHALAHFQHIQACVLSGCCCS